MGGYFLCGAFCLCRSSRVRKLCCPRKRRSPPPTIVRSMQDVERGVRQSDSEVSDNEVSDNEVSDNEVSDNEVPDNEVSDNEVSDMVSAADNVSRESTSAPPRTSRIVLDPLEPLESAPVPKVVVETVPLKSILSKAVDPTVESTQKVKKSVHWGRELVRMKITRTHFQRLANPSDFKPWTAFPTLE